jgi:hypothetical protein
MEMHAGPWSAALNFFKSHLEGLGVEEKLALR